MTPEALSRRRRRIFLATWITYAGFYLTRKAFAAAKVALQSDPALAFSTTQLGDLDSAFLAAYMIGQVPMGLLADRFGPRRIVLAGIAGSVLACAATTLASTFAAFVGLTIAQGLSQAAGWPALIKTMAAWFPARRRGVVMGWWATNYALGGFIAGPMAGYAIEASGDWRSGFLFPALVFALVGLGFGLFQQDRPEDLQSEEPSPDASAGSPEPPERSVELASPPASGASAPRWFRQPALWVLGVAYFLLKPARDAALLWGPKFMSETLGAGPGRAALMSGFFELAGPLGLVVSGYLSDRLFRARRTPVCVLMMAAAGLGLILLAPSARLGPWGACLGMAVVGFSLHGPDALLSATAAMDWGGRRASGAAAGLVNASGALGSAIVSGALFGRLAEAFGWSAAFGAIAALTLAAAVVLIPLWGRAPDGRAAGSPGQ